MDREIPLTGGRTQKSVVRIGETVRRQPRQNFQFVRELLSHLERAGFEGAPRWLGTDEQGREMFSYIEGIVPPDLGHWSDGQLAAAAHLIRRYHDATESLCGDDLVACHNDLSPCNFVFRLGVPIAIIDFDNAEANWRIYDLGYAAWHWLDLGNDEYSLVEQLRRLSLFADASGVETEALIESVLTRQKHQIDDWERRGNLPNKAWAESCRTWTLKLAAQS